MKQFFKTYKIPLITVLGVLFIDQFIKIYIKLNYPLGEVGRAADWCIIHFTENPGMAFGFEFGGEYGKIILSVFRILACVGGGFYIRYIIKQKEHPGFIVSVSLILAGALGNIFDSAFYGVLFSESDEFNVSKFLPAEGGYEPFLYGRVVDMFYFPMWNGYFPDWVPFVGGESFQFFRPIFNFADMSISFGVGIIIAFQKKFTQKAEAKPDQEAAKNEESK
ncbi:MAG: lipoprotein signal peptidase [Sphingobacteriaceae bacterium]|nr:lipoprotein signal peptidase [Sphingobacteriaceae bacterium]